jgi:hypothetical protein
VGKALEYVWVRRLDFHLQLHSRQFFFFILPNANIDQTCQKKSNGNELQSMTPGVTTLKQDN